jgi:hypothetical protein
MIPPDFNGELNDSSRWNSVKGIEKLFKPSNCKTPLIVWNIVQVIATRHGHPDYYKVHQPDENTSQQISSMVFRWEVQFDTILFGAVEYRLCRNGETALQV